MSFAITLLPQREPRMACAATNGRRRVAAPLGLPRMASSRASHGALAFAGPAVDKTPLRELRLCSRLASSDPPLPSRCGASKPRVPHSGSSRFNMPTTTPGMPCTSRASAWSAAHAWRREIQPPPSAFRTAHRGSGSFGTASQWEAGSLRCKSSSSPCSSRRRSCHPSSYGGPYHGTPG